MADALACPRDSDRCFGPRVDMACRAFDFTLFFEDVFFAGLPSALFLVLLAPRLLALRRASVKLASNRQAMYKLVIPSNQLLLLTYCQLNLEAINEKTSQLKNT
jgi:ATP-binding cassette subfamily C (CFTR/MRP) protein 1